MRLWSIHPKYLDYRGLVALWREGLLAKKVLLGETKGYINHPQLYRFKDLENPVGALNNYLFFIFQEARERDYNFDNSKLSGGFDKRQLTVTDGQINFEFSHLLKKLEKRNPEKYKEICTVKYIKPNPIFIVEKGPIEEWEKSFR